MIHVYGNCQASNVAKVLQGGLDCVEFTWIQSPAFYRVHTGSFGPALERQVEKYDVPFNYLRAGVGYPWKPPLRAGDAAPNALVFSLFTEPTPLLVDKEYGNGIFFQSGALKDFPEFGEWVSENFTRLDLGRDGYLKRYMRMLGKVRKLFPNAPVVVVIRSRLAPAYNPNPGCLLSAWGSHHASIVDALTRLESEDQNFHLVHTDRIIARQCLKHGESIDRFYPIVVFDDGDPSRARRDLEHASDDLWQLVAQSVMHALNGGGDGCMSGAEVEEFLEKPYEAEDGQIDLVGLLTSGNRHNQSRALARMVLDDRNHGPTLVEHGERLVQHRIIVDSLCAYARKKPDPALSTVFEAQLRLAKTKLISDGDTHWYGRHRKHLEKLREVIAENCN